MSIPVIHPNWSQAPKVLTDGFSLEITAKDVDALREASPKIRGARGSTDLSDDDTMFFFR